jgi:hypothetical protein
MDEVDNIGQATNMDKTLQCQWRWLNTNYIKDVGKTRPFMWVALMKHTMWMKLDDMDEIVSMVKFTTQMQLPIWLTFHQID